MRIIKRGVIWNSLLRWEINYLVCVNLEKKKKKEHSP